MRIITLLLSFWLLVLPVSALEIQAPAPGNSAKLWMPEDTGSFGEGFLEILRKGMEALSPELREASRISLSLVAVVMLVCVVKTVSPGSHRVLDAAGCAGAAALLLDNTGAMVPLAAETLRQLLEYGKLLLPVMAGAMAAQGGVSGSAALYAGASFFTALLQGMMAGYLVPGIWLFLALHIGSCITGQAFLKRLADLLKAVISWCLKIVLMVFTTCLSLSGVVSGTTDAAALKAAKVSISTFVPVVGGVLADASEAVLTSAGLLKNTAGIYGILAVLALFIHPFLKIGIQYLVLKLTAALCLVFGGGQVTTLLDAFAAAMGLLVAMIGAGCIMVLISTVCFLKGVG